MRSTLCFLCIKDVREICHDALCDIGLVHGVNVDVVNACGEEIKDLVGGIGDAGLLHGGGLVAELIHKIKEAAGHKRARELLGALDLLLVSDGHDAGDHGHGNAGLANAVEKAIKQVVIKKHLRGEEIAACVHLFFQITDVL